MHRRTELGRRLEEIRERIVASGQRLLDWREIESPYERCVNCRHWRPEQSPESNWGACGLTTSRHPSMAYPESWEGRPGVLWTLPDFGCSQFEENE
jgi:hypothetical protein